MANRGQLRNSARVAADQDGGEFPSDEALNDILDRAASAVWRRLLNSGWTPNRTIVAIPATGASSYTVGTDVHTISSVQRIDGTSNRVPLRRLKPEELADYLNGTTGPAVAYLITGGATTAVAIEFYPTPTTGNYEVRYTTRFPGFVSDGDNWYGPDGSDELIILTAAAEAMDKEQADSSKVKARLAQRWDDVVEGAQWQDAQGTQTVRDTRNRGRALPDGGAFDFTYGEGWY